MKIDENKILFVNVAPMEYFKGHEGVIYESGGDYWKEYGFGHEMLNFLDIDGYCYGNAPKRFKLKAISDDIQEDENGEYIDNVLVVFTSKSSTGTCVTAFYVGARLYGNPIKDKALPMRSFDNSVLENDSLVPFNDFIGYEMVCKTENAYVIPLHKRDKQVPRAKSESDPGMGQSPQWYAKGEKNAQYKKIAIAYIEQLLRDANGEDDREFQNEVDMLIMEKGVTVDNSGIQRSFSNLPTKPQEEKETNKSISLKYKRNPAKSQYVIEKQAKHLCQIDCDHPTFKRRDGVHSYVEAHHLIPTKNQDQFPRVDLDNPANIVAICSNCHNCIHYGHKPEAEKLIAQLYEIKRAALKEATLDIGLERLLELQ